MNGFDRIECDIKRNGLFFSPVLLTYAHIVSVTALAFFLLLSIIYAHRDTFLPPFTFDSISFALYTQSIVTLDEQIQNAHTHTHIIHASLFLCQSTEEEKKHKIRIYSIRTVKASSLHFYKWYELCIKWNYIEKERKNKNRIMRERESELLNGIKAGKKTNESV